MSKDGIKEIQVPVTSTKTIYEVELTGKRFNTFNEANNHMRQAKRDKAIDQVADALIRMDPARAGEPLQTRVDATYLVNRFKIEYVPEIDTRPGAVNFVVEPPLRVASRMDIEEHLWGAVDMSSNRLMRVVDTLLTHFRVFER